MNTTTERNNTSRAANSAKCGLIKSLSEMQPTTCHNFFSLLPNCELKKMRLALACDVNILSQASSSDSANLVDLHRLVQKSMLSNDVKYIGQANSVIENAMNERNYKFGKARALEYATDVLFYRTCIVLEPTLERSLLQLSRLSRLASSRHIICLRLGTESYTPTAPLFNALRQLDFLLAGQTNCWSVWRESFSRFVMRLDRLEALTLLVGGIASFSNQYTSDETGLLQRYCQDITLNFAASTNRSADVQHYINRIPQNFGVSHLIHQSLIHFVYHLVQLKGNASERQIHFAIGSTESQSCTLSSAVDLRKAAAGLGLLPWLYARETICMPFNLENLTDITPAPTLSIFNLDWIVLSRTTTLRSLTIHKSRLFLSDMISLSYTFPSLKYLSLSEISVFDDHGHRPSTHTPLFDVYDSIREPVHKPVDLESTQYQQSLIFFFDTLFGLTSLRSLRVTLHELVLSEYGKVQTLELNQLIARDSAAYINVLKAIDKRQSLGLRSSSGSAGAFTKIESDFRVNLLHAFTRGIDFRSNCI